MWGCKGGSINNIETLFIDYISKSNVNDKYIDQYFLRDVIYPICKESLFSHDEYYNFEIEKTNKIGRAHV